MTSRMMFALVLLAMSGGDWANAKRAGQKANLEVERKKETELHSVGPIAEGQVVDVRYEPVGDAGKFVLEFEGKTKINYKYEESARRVLISAQGLQLPAELARRIETSALPGVVTEIVPYNTGNEEKPGIQVVLQLRKAATIEAKNRTNVFELHLAPLRTNLAQEDDGKNNGVSHAGWRPRLKRAPSAEMISMKELNGKTAKDTVKLTASAEDKSLELAKELIKTLDTPVESRVYKGSKVTIESEEVSVHDVFRLVGAASGLNIITTTDVSGNVNLSLKDVPWDQLLDIVLQERQLKAVNNGNVIRITTINNYQQELETQLRSQVVAERVEPVYMAIIPVNYAKADEIKTAVSNLLVGSASTESTPSTQSSSTPTTSSTTSSQQSMIRVTRSPTTSPSTITNETATNSTTTGYNSPTTTTTTAPAPDEFETIQAFAKGKIEVDTRTNSLLVTHTADQIKRIRVLVKELDVPTPQVLIESKVVQASETFSRTLSVDWGGFVQPGFQGPQAGNAPGAGFAINSFSSGSSFAVTNPSAASGSGLFGMRLGQGVLSKLDLFISMAEVNSQAKIMASPRVIVDNNHSASITDGVAIAIVSTSTVSGSAVTAQEFVEANLTLSVTPQVTNSGQVVMDLNVTQQSPVSSGALTNIQSKNLTTKVLVESGSTLVLGGVYNYQLNKDESGIPLLKDLPLLGNLFKRTNNRQNRSELLIFVTPRILDTTIVDDKEVEDEGIIL